MDNKFLLFQTIQGPLNSASFCRYIVDEYAHIKTLECHETHLLRPFSYSGAGVKTDIRWAFKGVRSRFSLWKCVAVDPFIL